MFKNQKPRVTLQSNHFALNIRLCSTSASEFKLLKSPLHKERRNPKESEKQRRVKQEMKSCEAINRGKTAKQKNKFQDDNFFTVQILQWLETHQCLRFGNIHKVMGLPSNLRA